MSRGKCCVNSWEYVNPAHKFYCEFLKAASVAPVRLQRQNKFLKSHNASKRGFLSFTAPLERD